MKKALDQAVRERAKGLCEYCLLPEAVSNLKFSLDHIIARQHGGGDDPNNLALAFVFCNSHKGPNIAGIDPDTGDQSRLYHPRQDKWSEHFLWNGALLIGLSTIGRATIAVLDINNPKYVAVRATLIAEGRIFSESAPSDHGLYLDLNQDEDEND